MMLNLLVSWRLIKNGLLFTLTQAYGPLEEKALALVAFEVLKIVKACHDSGILHGEILRCPRTP